MLSTDPRLVIVNGRRRWLFPDGRTLPVVSGGSDDAPPGDPPADPPPAGTDGDKPLGEAGEKALQAWKDRAKAAEADAKRANDLQAELDELKRSQMGDHEKAVADARREAAEQARTEALATVNGRLFTAELKAASTGALLPAAAQDLLVDTAVALKLLGLDEIPVTSTGDINSEAISQAVAAYVEARPHLAASATQTPGSVDQGARTTAPAKSIDDEIAEAEAAGDWDRARRLKLHKHAAK